MIERLNESLRLLKEGKHEEAEKVAKEVLEQDPTFEHAWSQLGRIYGEMGRLEESIQAYGNEVKNHPQDGDAWLWLGEKYHQNAEPEKALEALEMALSARLETNSIGTVWTQIGMTHYFRLRQLEKAEEAFRKAIALEPSIKHTWYFLGLILDEQGRKEESGQAFENEVNINPQNGDAWIGVGVKYARTGEYTKSLAALERALSEKRILNDEAIIYYNQGYTLKQMEEFDKAEKALLLALKSDPEFPNASYQLGCIYDIQERYEESLQAYEVEVKHNPKHGDAWLALGVRYDKIGKMDEAIEACQKALTGRLTEYPESLVLYNLSVIYRNSNQFDKAEEAIRRAIDLELRNDLGQYWEAMGTLVHILIDTGRCDDALLIFKWIREIGRGEVTLGGVTMNQRLLERCSRGFQERDLVINKLYDEGAAAFENGDYNTAVEKFQAFLKLYRLDPTTMHSLKLALRNRGTDTRIVTCPNCGTESEISIFPSDYPIDQPERSMIGVYSLTLPRGEAEVPDSERGFHCGGCLQKHTYTFSCCLKCFNGWVGQRVTFLSDLNKETKSIGYTIDKKMIQCENCGNKPTSIYGKSLEEMIIFWRLVDLQPGLRQHIRIPHPPE